MYLISVDCESDQCQFDMCRLVKKASNAFGEECVGSCCDIQSITQQATGHFGGKIVFVSHGSPSAVYCGMPRQCVIDENSAHKFSGCQVIVFACLTAQQLGCVLAKFVYIFIGFDAVIGVPDASMSIIELYISHLSQLIGFFHFLEAGKVEAENAKSFLLEFSQRIDESQDLVSKSGVAGVDEYICLKNLRSDLCIWLLGNATPIKAPGAPPLALLW